LSNYGYIIGGAKGVSKTGLMFVDATGSDIGTNGLEIKLLVNDSQEADRVLVYNEANQSSAYTNYDAAKYRNTDFPNIYTLSADAKPLAIDMQDINAQLEAGQTEVIIPITITREANKRYASLKMELSANTTGMDISLKDNQNKSVEPWFTGNVKNVQFAAADAEINRYSLVFKRNTTSTKDLLKDIANNKNNTSIAVYPNPTDGKLTLKLSNGESYQGGYQILDMTGRILMEGQSMKIQIDASKLPTGQYIIKTENQVSIFNKN
jgi:sRNA-binding protein